jgi:hypothetical protein
MNVHTSLPVADEDRGDGWLVFASCLFLLSGVLNVVWGIAAIGDSKFFANGQELVFSSLKTWGWIVLVLGVLELVAAWSISQRGAYGRWFGIFAAFLNGIGALMSLSGQPLWSLAVFGVDVLIIYGLAVHGGRSVYAR